MTPQVAIDIVDRDRTGPGQKSAERKLSGFAAKSTAIAKKSGLAALGEQIERFAKLGRMDFSLEGLGRGLRGIGRASGEIREGFGGATTKAIGLGAAGESALGGIAAIAGTAVGAVAGLVTVTGAAGVAAYMLGDKWAKAGGQIERTGEGLALTASQYQGLTAANERFGVSADATTVSLDSLQSTLFGAFAGSNNEALAGLNQLGITIHRNKDGVIDLQQAYLDLSDAIARQKDPAAQKRLAAIFGVSGSLNAMVKGSAVLKAESADYLSTTAPLTPEEARAAEETERKAIILKQRLGGIEKAGGIEAMKATGAIADAGKDKAESAARAAQAAAKGVSNFAADPGAAIAGLAHSGLEAGRHLVEGAERAGKAIGDEFMKFVSRIEHQESRGHQFEYRKGRGHGTLTSSAGAMGAMQMLPATAKAAAKRAGVAWDPQRFATDQAYNEQLGAAELAHLTQKYGGDETLAAAGYNAGPGNVDKWIKRFGDPRKGQISDKDFADKIPFAETRDYVKKTADAHVTVTFKGLPQGATVRSAGAPGVAVDTQVARAMEGP